MAGENDDLNAILSDTIIFFRDSLKPFYFQLLDTIKAGRILESSMIGYFDFNIKQQIKTNDHLKDRLNLLRDEINRNANPDDINSLKLLDRLLINGGNGLKAMKETCDGLATLSNLSSFFNQSRRDKPSSINKNRKTQ